jgi:drug/metabolite transporter (DMT)-like permease
MPDAGQAAALGYLAAGVTVLGFLSWYSAVGLLGVERAGLFSGVLPVSALLFSAALGVADITPARLGAVAVVALGVTLGVRRGAVRLGEPSTPRLRTASSGA